LKKYFDTRKIIYLTQHDKQWKNHLRITKMILDLSKPPQIAVPITNWIQRMANIGKEAKKEARTIILKHTNKIIQKATKHTQNMLDKTPKKRHNRIFKKTTSNH
jgi:hypothetical protein